MCRVSTLLVRATHTVPSPTARSRTSAPGSSWEPWRAPTLGVGAVHTRIGGSARRVRGSTRVTRPSAESATQTPPESTARAVGCEPTGIETGAAPGAEGSMRVSRSARRLVTQMAPSPVAIPAGSTRTGAPTTRRVAGSML